MFTTPSKTGFRPLKLLITSLRRTCQGLLNIAERDDNVKTNPNIPYFAALASSQDPPSKSSVTAKQETQKPAREGFNLTSTGSKKKKSPCTKVLTNVVKKEQTDKGIRTLVKSK